MKKIIFAMAILSTFSAWAETCQIRIERDGIASQDILHRGEVMVEKGANFGFVRNLKEDISLDECIKFANEEGERLTNHDSVVKAKSKITIRHASLGGSPLNLELKQSK